MRDDAWLQELLYYYWENYFVDVPRKNRVIIRFGKKSYRQLGCIRWAHKESGFVRKLLNKYPDSFDDPRISLITITGYFKDEEVPDYVVHGTLCHELCHYVHGFHSPLAQIYEHPHRGNVIQKEMYRRELREIYETSQIWLESNWQTFILKQKRLAKSR